MQSKPVQGTGLEESPQGSEVEVPVGTPEGVVFAPGVLGVLVAVQAATCQRAGSGWDGLNPGADTAPIHRRMNCTQERMKTASRHC